jgi:1,4-alpha-glucan branching enzyme
MKTQLKTKTATGNQVVHFELKDLPAAKVCIAGTFNDWSQEATEMIPLGGGRWVKDLTLPPGTYEYRLMADGRWMTDPACPHTVPNPFGGMNCLLVVTPKKPVARRSRGRITARAA